MTKKYQIKLLLLIPLILMIYILFMIIKLIIIFPWTPENVVYINNPEKADLIVVLDGEYYVRIDYAFDLLNQNYSDILFAPSVRYQQSKERISEQLNNMREDAYYFEGIKYESTYEEALATKNFISELKSNSIIINGNKKITQKISKLLLVTSPYHSYRAWWIFQKVLADIKVISVPVPFDKNWFSLDKIDEDMNVNSIVKNEQIKFFLYYIFYSWRIY